MGAKRGLLNEKELLIYLAFQGFLLKFLFTFVICFFCQPISSKLSIFIHPENIKKPQVSG